MFNSSPSVQLSVKLHTTMQLAFALALAAIASAVAQHNSGAWNWRGCANYETYVETEYRDRVSVPLQPCSEGQVLSSLYMEGDYAIARCKLERGETAQELTARFITCWRRGMTVPQGEVTYRIPYMRYEMRYVGVVPGDALPFDHKHCNIRNSSNSKP